jgi:anti-sigma factor RsiW
MENEMKNSWNKEIIQRYADGELSKDEAKKVETLINESSEAKREYDEIKAVGHALRNAMCDETEQVDFCSVWAYVNEGIEREDRSGLRGLLDHFFAAITPKKAAAAFAGALALIAAVIIVWELSLAPAPVHAALTTVESIQYGDNPNIVVAVDTLENPTTTIVWIEGIEIGKENNPPNEI